MTSEKFWSTRARDIMSQVVVTTRCEDSIEEVAQMMADQDINAVPVIYESGKCVGILTSQDIVEYESIRTEVESEYKYGYFFDLARFGIEPQPSFAKIRFDEVVHHMTRKIVTANPDDPIRELAEKMCTHQCHHVIIVDLSMKLCGIVSSLDILAHGVDMSLPNHDRHISTSDSARSGR